jgi:hypothetical protein
MTHDYIQPEESVKQVVLQHKDYNLDKKDNLDDLPALPGIYAICGRVNGQPVNARFVGSTEDLLAAVKSHYTEAETDEGLRNYMRSIKIKMLLYTTMPYSTEEERQAAKQEWENKLHPKCTDELNQVY